LPFVDLFDLNEYIELEYSNFENKEEYNFNAKDELASIFPKLLFVMRNFKD